MKIALFGGSEKLLELTHRHTLPCDTGVRALRERQSREANQAHFIVDLGPTGNPHDFTLAHRRTLFLQKLKRL